MDHDARYRELVERAGLVEASVVPGCSVFKEDCLAIWAQITGFLDRRLKEKGFTTAYFPLFIPEAEMKKQADHYEGFRKELMVADGLVVRPTSEMVIYPTLKRWISRGVPIKVNQFCSVVRWERLKPNLPLIRDNEFLWQESHTVHATREEAEVMAREMLAVYKELIEGLLAIPTVAGAKPPHRLFPGAEYTLALEAIMPSVKSVQMATSHFLGQRFSRPLDLTYHGEPVWQSCHGVTTRLIGAMVMMHSDARGLILPPRIAPVQVALDGTEDYRETLGPLRTGVVDDPVLKGVPLVLSRGRGLTLTRRDTGEAVPVTEATLPATAARLLEEIQQALWERAQARVPMHAPAEYGEFIRTAQAHHAYQRAGWCGAVNCASAIKQDTGSSLRVTSPGTGQCIRCRAPTDQSAIFAPAY
ncbi:MAG: proline--tRNA ligase [Candidatus Aenigmarchaeota archaeon]|nr:proline--tRNA ligase [Candidatus Aenigmarchaeota archaeon]